MQEPILTSPKYNWERDTFETAIIDSEGEIKVTITEEAVDELLGADPTIQVVGKDVHDKIKACMSQFGQLAVKMRHERGLADRTPISIHSEDVRAFLVKR